jgi:hypothetical protein
MNEPQEPEWFIPRERAQASLDDRYHLCERLMTFYRTIIPRTKSGLPPIQMDVFLRAQGHELNSSLALPTRPGMATGLVRGPPFHKAGRTEYRPFRAILPTGGNSHGLQISVQLPRK